MSKKLLAKVLAFTMCAAMVMQPVISFAAEEPEGEALLSEDGQLEADLGVTRIEDGILTIVPFEGAVKYTIYAGNERYQTVETTVDLVKMCYDLDLAFGEYDVSITHWDQNYHMINRPQHVMFTYDTLPPEGIHQVTHIEGGSTNLPKYLMCGYTLPVTGFYFGNFLDIQVIEWQKKINGEFVYVGPNGGAHVVSSGAYKVLVKVSLAEGYEYTHEFGNELTMVEEFGGEEWTSVDVERYDNGKIKSATFLSPAYYPMGDDPIFARAYHWMAEQMRIRIGEPPIKGIEYPMWAWYQYNSAKDNKPPRSSKNMKDGVNVYMEIEIPDNEVLLSDYGSWHAPLNEGPIDDWKRIYK